MKLLFIKLGAAAALLVALIFGVKMWEHSIRANERGLVVAEYNSKIDALNAQARAELATETAKTRVIEKTLQDFKNTQENTDVINEKTISVLADKLHGLVGRTGGLLTDPNSQGCGGSGGSTAAAIATATSPGGPDGPQAGGVLSKPLTDLLFFIVDNADASNLAYISCKADTAAVRAACSK